MSSTPSAIDRAIKALTYDELYHDNEDVTDTAPLLQRSIAQDLRQIESAISGRGKTLLGAIAESIDEALLCLAEHKEMTQ